MSYALIGNATHQDLNLDRVLPGAMLIKGVAILDESLDAFLSSRGMSIRKPYKDDLFGRISFLADNGHISNDQQLHSARDLRNKLAHDPSYLCEWPEVDEHIKQSENCLVHLGLANVTGHLEFFGERSRSEGSTEPGVMFEQKISYGVKENGIVALEQGYIRKFHQRNPIMNNQSSESVDS